MKKNSKIFSLPLLITLMTVSWCKAQEWQPAGDRIQTRWAAEVTPENVWKEYPRPQLVRENWMNLNGLWEYSIADKGSKKMGTVQGKILVPFAVESSLSGVGKSLNEKQELWYHRNFKVPEEWSDKDILLHFGAVDWEMTLWVNDKKVGDHRGGSDPFSFDISKYMSKDQQEITIRVWDPTNTDIQPRGKQSLDPKGIFYTAVSGIWQTVWLEPVAPVHIDTFTPIADIDNAKVDLNTSIANVKKGDQLAVTILFDGEKVHEQTYAANGSIAINIPDMELWSPAFPNLYQVKLGLQRNGQTLDEVESYFAMRKISLAQDEHGINRLMLNNEPLFQYGTLDQGWWPDGLLTPPSDKAMRYDIDIVKQLGFNMIRKHIKVEPDRYYYYADSVGLLLWQDMPSGFLSMHDPEQHVAFDATEDWDRPDESSKQFEMEWKNIMDSKRFFPSIVVWVPFNEGWGQYDTRRVVEWTMKYDPTRLVNGTSGWTDRQVGNFFDAHQYPGPGMEPISENKGRAVVLGEFGGLGHPVKDHIWDPSMRNWGYRTYTDKDTLLNEYTQLIFNLYPELHRGLAGAIYTQTTDVEGEVNGLMTYDREVIKFPQGIMRVLHAPLYDHDYSGVHFILRDSEVEDQPMYFAEADPGAGWLNSTGELNSHQGSVKVEKGGSVWVKREFDLDERPGNLAMKIYAHGDVEVYLNGKLVDKKFYRTKRHYDDVNLSDYSNYLKKGKNEIAVKLGNSPDESLFDFGLYTY